MGTFLIVMGVVLTLSAGFVAWHFIRAPYGYQDERGFHLGEPPMSIIVSREKQEADLASDEVAA